MVVLGGNYAVFQHGKPRAMLRVGRAGGAACSRYFTDNYDRTNTAEGGGIDGGGNTYNQFNNYFHIATNKAVVSYNLTGPAGNDWNTPAKLDGAFNTQDMCEVDMTTTLTIADDTVKDMTQETGTRGWEVWGLIWVRGDSATPPGTWLPANCYYGFARDAEYLGTSTRLVARRVATSSTTLWSTTFGAWGQHALGVKTVAGPNAELRYWAIASSGLITDSSPLETGNYIGIGCYARVRGEGNTLVGDVTFDDLVVDEGVSW